MDFPIEKKGKGEDLFAFNLTVGIVFSMLAQIRLSSWSL
jgi:hypothetical protein